ncbi:hypothetical protein CDAR_407711 [Caerostris darwini]|uniref:Uncharacterized protein n=1 Tax=Caerostris darwini TaxID=1538125 RepID=A0AAV4Q0Q0_9ARAC|nr:hypothetical protein CDAR_407711 [Caerostris darwini]
MSGVNKVIWAAKLCYQREQGHGARLSRLRASPPPSWRLFLLQGRKKTFSLHFIEDLPALDDTFEESPGQLREGSLKESIARNKYRTGSGFRVFKSLSKHRSSCEERWLADRPRKRVVHVSSSAGNLTHQHAMAFSSYDNKISLLIVARRALRDFIGRFGQ